MKRIINVITNSIFFSFYKIVHFQNFETSLIQNFERVKIKLNKKGKIKLGSHNQGRGNLYLICQSGELIIGNHCFFNINSSITCLKKVKIGDYCTFGNNLVIVDHDHDLYNNNKFVTDEVIIENNVWIGANVVILKGVKIGEGSVIAAGSVVTKNVEKNMIYGGIPAKKIKSRLKNE